MNNCRNSMRSCLFNWALVAGSALVFTDRAKRTMQSSAGKDAWRNNSRAARLMALRVTARGASRLAATTPRRALGN